ncbi:Homologous recombination factor with OB-fold [Balamuthia mandrillaris]
MEMDSDEDNVLFGFEAQEDEEFNEGTTGLLGMTVSSTTAPPSSFSAASASASKSFAAPSPPLLSNITHTSSTSFSSFSSSSASASPLPQDILSVHTQSATSPTLENTISSGASSSTPSAELQKTQNGGSYKAFDGIFKTPLSTPKTATSTKPRAEASVPPQSTQHKKEFAKEFLSVHSSASSSSFSARPKQQQPQPQPQPNALRFITPGGSLAAKKKKKKQRVLVLDEEDTDNHDEMKKEKKKKADQQPHLLEEEEDEKDEIEDFDDDLFSQTQMTGVPNKKSLSRNRRRRSRIPGPAGDLEDIIDSPLKKGKKKTLLTSLIEPPASQSPIILKEKLESSVDTAQDKLVLGLDPYLSTEVLPKKDPDFYRGPWLSMCQTFDLPPFTAAIQRLASSLSKSLSQQSQDPERSSQPRSQEHIRGMIRNSVALEWSIGLILEQTYVERISHLFVLVKTMVTDINASVTLKDPTGEMQGTIHHKALAFYRNKIRVGAVLKLVRVTVFSPTPEQHYLNITLNNIVAVWPRNEPRPRELRNIPDWRNTNPLTIYARRAVEPLLKASQQRAQQNVQQPSNANRGTQHPSGGAPSSMPFMNSAIVQPQPSAIMSPRFPVPTNNNSNPRLPPPPPRMPHETFSQAFAQQLATPPQPSYSTLPFGAPPSTQPQLPPATQRNYTHQHHSYPDYTTPPPAAFNAYKHAQTMDAPYDDDQYAEDDLLFANLDPNFLLGLERRQIN